MKPALIALALSLLAACSGGAPVPTPPPTPPPTVWTITNGTVAVTAEARFGSSITHVVDAHGFDYDNIVDHGREWQVAYQLDGLDEGENPTEAGSAADAAGPTSSSVIIAASAPTPNVISTVVQPAFWYAYQGATVSPDMVSKTVTIGAAGIPNVIRWDVSIELAADHSMAVFEPLAGYSPALPMLYVEQADGSFAAATQADGGTVTPATSWIAASTDGNHALGVLAAAAPKLTWNQLDFLGSGIDAFGCGWIQTPAPAGHYDETCYVAVGTLAEVEAALTWLRAAGL